MSRHSPEPWHVGMRPEYDADYITADRIVGGPTGRDEYDREAGVWDVQDDEVYVICQPDDERDARRIVACVNALAGLTDEQVAALPRLVAWFRDRVDVFSIFDPESKQLREIYPPK